MKENFPIVNLISMPDDMLKTIYTACRTCYSADYPINIWDKSNDREKMLKPFKNVLA